MSGTGGFRRVFHCFKLGSEILIRSFAGLNERVMFIPSVITNFANHLIVENCSDYEVVVFEDNFHSGVSLHTDCFDFICDDLQVTSDLFANDDFNAKPLIEDLIGNLGHVGVSLLPDFSNIVAMRSVVNG